MGRLAPLLLRMHTCHCWAPDCLPVLLLLPCMTARPRISPSFPKAWHACPWYVAQLHPLMSVLFFGLLLLLFVYVCVCVLLQFATEAALTILRIDDLIKLDPPQEDPNEE